LRRRCPVWRLQDEWPGPRIGRVRPGALHRSEDGVRESGITASPKREQGLRPPLLALRACFSVNSVAAQRLHPSARIAPCWRAADEPGDLARRADSVRAMAGFGAPQQSRSSKGTALIRSLVGGLTRSGPRRLLRAGAGLLLRFFPNRLAPGSQ